MTVLLGFLAFSAGGSGNVLGYHHRERSMSDRLLGAPECFPILLSNL
jgi:hypothetical protein